MQNENKYPNITLFIDEEGAAKIKWFPEEGTEKELATSNDTIDNILTEFASNLGVEDLSLENVWELANTGDSMMVQLGGPNLDQEALDHSNITEQVNAYSHKYTSEPTGSPKVDDQLKKDWQSDVMAAAAEALYDLLISQTLLFADDLAVETITLDDKLANPRLAERMALAMEDIGIDLYLPEVVTTNSNAKNA